MRFIADMDTGQGLGFIADHLHHRISQIFAIQCFAALSVDDIPLLVHHVIIFNELFAYFKIVPFHFGLSIFNGPADHVVLDGLALLHTEFFHDAGDALAAENP